MEQFPLLEPHMDDILPKKSQLELMKMYVSPPSSPLPSPNLPTES